MIPLFIPNQFLSPFAIGIDLNQFSRRFGTAIRVLNQFPQVAHLIECLCMESRFLWKKDVDMQIRQSRFFRSSQTL